MSLVKGNCIVAQSGGPTAVINSSVYGVLKRFLEVSEGGKVYAGANGIQGIIEGKIFDLGALDSSEQEMLKYMPSAALGSNRYKLKDPKTMPEEYENIFSTFEKLDIKYFFYVGGNDSMDAASKLNEYAQANGHDVKIFGVPKTIDNDLVGTDHCPGFASAAKYICNTAIECWMDVNCYKDEGIIIIEVMGRDTGWLAASSGIIQKAVPDVNQLIYLPEAPFTESKFIEDVKKAREKNGKILIIASEGLKDENGEYINIDSNCYSSDAFGHKQLGGIGRYLQEVIKENIHNRVKMIELNITQRCARHCASKTDIDEAIMVGEAAVDYAIKGISGYMVGIKRTTDKGYKAVADLVPLNEVCNMVKKVPVEWINIEKATVNQEMIDYIEPLIVDQVDSFQSNGLVKYVNLTKKFVNLD
ncbi:pyrophosphate--fructose 6-phosphate 1-phosphotransferase [Clostridium polyendosporum]|uniref:Pyrophosphate--fructose 6-phosphate 1-phosphotransferase n=1 Tax=Clostridium polyendosporum TaxID=69208 RepID=A0A919RZ94_9CLOT|nr:6-phosphofructokinase [Clostridium polyendosporum]GIM28989.1 pyrophosphate--fructose 6-phosphate 1-phosphotransferase [Clostridium polyendosporum]